MSRFHSYLNTSATILREYSGDQPFSLFIKDFFREHKKHGSKDRKFISQLCYSYFRLGKALYGMPMEERILLSLFLCSSGSNELLQELKPEWNINAYDSFSEKLQVLEIAESSLEIFPWKNELGEGIDHHALNRSYLVQPDLFVRLRPGHEVDVKEKLAKAGVEYQAVDAACLALPNTTRLYDLIEIDAEAVVQDFNSQRTGSFILEAGAALEMPVKTWDCCAASGGKSILAYDLVPGIGLTVSDARPSILRNLKKRFETAGIKKYRAFTADLAMGDPPTGEKFDFIICDAPCTGSGTWGRTPEQLFYFTEDKIGYYSRLQRMIATAAISSLLPGGYFLYITCSVFREENEEQVAYLKDKLHLDLVRIETLKGYQKKADTLFAALLKKNSS